MSFKSIAKIFVGGSPPVCILVAWVVQRIQHIGVHGFFTCVPDGGDLPCAFLDAILATGCAIGVAWGWIEASNEIKKLSKEGKLLDAVPERK